MANDTSAGLVGCKLLGELLPCFHLAVFALNTSFRNYNLSKPWRLNSEKYHFWLLLLTTGHAPKLICTFPSGQIGLCPYRFIQTEDGYSHSRLHPGYLYFEVMTLQTDHKDKSPDCSISFLQGINAWQTVPGVRQHVVNLKTIFVVASIQHDVYTAAFPYSSVRGSQYGSWGCLFKGLLEHAKRLLSV